MPEPGPDTPATPHTNQARIEALEDAFRRSDAETVVVVPRVWACAYCGHIHAEAQTWQVDDGCPECNAPEDKLRLIGGIPEDQHLDDMEDTQA